MGPASENKTSAYVQAVAKELGVRPGDAQRARTRDLTRLTSAIIRHENGRSLTRQRPFARRRRRALTGSPCSSRAGDIRRPGEDGNRRHRARQMIPDSLSPSRRRTLLPPTTTRCARIQTFLPELQPRPGRAASRRRSPRSRTGSTPSCWLNHRRHQMAPRSSVPIALSSPETPAPSRCAEPTRAARPIPIASG